MEERNTLLAGCCWQLEIITIDSDPRLQSRYAARIPLLMLDDILVSETFLDKARLAAIFDDVLPDQH